VRRDGSRVRCFTRGGHDWANRFPAIVDAALRLKATSFLIDGDPNNGSTGVLGADTIANAEGFSPGAARFANSRAVQREILIIPA